MTSVVIGDIKYNLREDFTIKDYITLKNFDMTLPFNWPRIFSEGFNVPFDIAVTVPMKNLELGVVLIEAMLNPVHEVLNKNLYGGELINLDTITLGEFIDLEVLVEKGFHKNIKDILSILYKIEIKDTYLFKDFYKSIEYYLKWRENIYKSYQYLFNLDKYSDEEEEKRTNTDIRHSWYDVIMILADGKFLNVNKVTEQPLVSAFNWLAWNKDRLEKEELEIMKIKQEQKQRR